MYKNKLDKRLKILIILATIILMFAIFAEGKVFATEEIWRTEHLTQKHTKKEIIAKYKETLPKFDYSKSMYEIAPSYKAPYAAGKLKAGVVTDTLNQINYYRWLYGINEVTINEDKMERSQKGAVIQAATNELTHMPVQPDDMDDEFYKEAYAGCYMGWKVGDYYNGNCSWGESSPTNTIKGFISDLNNISEGSYVGHRLNLLDIFVNKTSFGYCNEYTALSMYYNSEGTNKNNEQFYSYPPAGFFPKQNFYMNEYWSFLCMEGYNIKDMKIQFTYNETVYEQPKYEIEDGCAIVFKFPDELKNALGGKTIPECNINIKITGLVDKNDDIINYSYNVNFFDINEILITGISFNKKEQQAYENDTITAQNIVIAPTNATEKYVIEWSSSNNDIATINSDGKIKCKKIGTTTITAKVGEYTASYTLNVKEVPPYILGDVNQDKKVNSLDAVEILKYVAKKKTLTDIQLLAADTTRDNKVNSLDAVKILKYVAKKINEI